MRRNRSRRSFLSVVAAGAVQTALGSQLAAQDASGDRGDRPAFIDIHTHLGAFHHGRELTAERLVRFMDLHGVEKACVLPLVSPEAAPLPQPTSTAIAAHREFADRIIPFCAVDPRAVSRPGDRPGHVVGVQGLIDILRRYQDQGCRGLGEHKTGLVFDAPRQMYLYEACAKTGLPILFHLDDLRNPDSPGLPRLANALQSFPEVAFIGHAAGFWASISADATLADFGRYPEVPKPVVPGGALDALMDRYDNLYGDLSEPGGERALARDAAFAREFLIRRADRLLFGTDVLMPDQPIPQFELLESFDLPLDVRGKIYRGNALKLLKLAAA